MLDNVLRNTRVLRKCTNYKTCQLRMHCNLRQSDTAQSLSALISPHLSSLKSFSLSVAVLQRFYCWYVSLRCDLELWPCDLDLWPWTCVVYQLRHDRMLYEIWAKSNNPRRSYCDLNIWPYDLEHVSCAPLCSWIVCTKFKLSQAISSWNVMIFYANTSCHAMTLTFDPLTLKVCGRSGVTWS